MCLLLDDIIKNNKKTTAILSMHSAIALELLRNLAKKHLEVPKDYSLLTFGQIPYNDILKTPLTCVNQHPYEIGVKSAEVLMHKINKDNDFRVTKVVIPCDIVLGKSCK